MRRMIIALGAFTLSLGGAAEAQSFQQCQNNQVAGAVAGGVLGGLAGAAITNDRGFRRGDFRGRGFRGGRFDRGFRGRGFRSGRGFRGRRGTSGVGIALGALAGSVVGSQLAGSANCNPSNVNQGGRYIPPRQPIQSRQAPIAPPLQGGPIAQNAGLECLDTDHVVTLADGTQVLETVTLCRQRPDGQWQIAG